MFWIFNWINYTARLPRYVLAMKDPASTANRLKAKCAFQHLTNPNSVPSFGSCSFTAPSMLNCKSVYVMYVQ